MQEKLIKYKIDSNNIFDNSNINIVNMIKKFTTFMTILQYFYQKKITDINIDIFENTDLMLITWRRWNYYHKFLFLYKKEIYNNDEKKLIEYYNTQNIKIIEVLFTPFYLISFMFEWLVTKYNEYLQYTEDKFKYSFYNFLVKHNLNDSSVYIVDGYISQHDIIKKININKNNRVNLSIATRKIKDWLIKKIFWLELRPNYTNLQFTDVKESMLTLDKIEELILNFLSEKWIKMVKRENLNDYAELEIDQQKKENYWKKILVDFLNLLDMLNIPINEDQKEKIINLQRINAQSSKKNFKEIDLFWSNLKLKDDISKFFMSLESWSSLVLVTWPTWSGKTTFLMTWLQELLYNHIRNVITLENPVEFLLVNEKWLVYQREINKDIIDYMSWLNDALRQKPDIVVLGEIRENKNENIAKQLIEAAKTGHLILWTLHASSLYDWYKRFKKMANTDETFLNYMINLRRIPLFSSNDYVNVYSHYLYDRSKSDKISENEMIDVDKWLYGINFKLIFLFLIWEIDINTLKANSSDLWFISQIMNKIKNTQFVQEMYSDEHKMDINILSWNTN